MEKLPEWVKTSDDYDRWKRGEGPSTTTGVHYNPDDFICTTCRNVGQPKKVTRGSFWIEVVLWLFMIVPGLIYTIWRLTTKTKVCPACGNPTMIPITTPMGRQLVESRG